MEKKSALEKHHFSHLLTCLFETERARERDRQTDRDRGELLMTDLQNRLFAKQPVLPGS